MVVSARRHPSADQPSPVETPHPEFLPGGELHDSGWILTQDRILNASRGMAESGQQWLTCELVSRAVLAVGGSEGGDLPSAVLLGEIEEISAAVIELAIYEEVEGRPVNGQVAVDVDTRFVDPLLDVGGSRGGYAAREVLCRDLAEVALLHLGKNSAGYPCSLVGGRIKMRHAGGEQDRGGVQKRSQREASCAKSVPGRLRSVSRGLSFRLRSSGHL